jgi:hypothetical protein
MQALKIAGGITGSVALLVAVPALAVGIGLLAWAGAGSTVHLPTVAVSTDHPAVVTGDMDLVIDDGYGWLVDPGTVRVTARTFSGDGDLFVGVGPTADVERFLDGVSQARVDEIDRPLWGPDHEVTLVETDGLARAGSPGDEDFWVAASEGRAAELDWEMAPGRWTAVVMNADGSAGVGADLDIEVGATPIRVAGAVVATIGGLALLSGIGLLVAAVRRPRSQA